MKFYAKGLNNEGYIKNLEVLGFHDLNNYRIFQMALYRKDNRYYLYGAGRGSQICPVLDVTDPCNPELLNAFPATTQNNPAQKVLKIQACDGLLICALAAGVGPINSGNKSGGGLVGIQIFDIETDPVHPKALGFWDAGVPSGGAGVHRFCYNGGRYVYLAADCNGFEGMILRIVDIADPANPVEVGRWFDPSQYVNGCKGRSYNIATPPSPEGMAKGFLHGPPFVREDGYCFCGWTGKGFRVLDVRDVTQPKLVGELPLQPTFSSKYAGAYTHTAMPLPGRDYAVVTNEGERFAWFGPHEVETMISTCAQALNNLHMIDVHDPANPTLIAEFPYPEVPEDWPWKNFNDCGLGVNGPFGPHNIHEPMSNKPWLEQRGDRVYCCYFHAGLRIYDVSDPYYIKEIAYFIPPHPEKWEKAPGPLLATTEDIVVDDRGNIIIDTLEDGIYILKSLV